MFIDGLPGRPVTLDGLVILFQNVGEIFRIIQETPVSDHATVFRQLHR